MNYDLKSNSSTSVSYVCVSSFSYGVETVSSRPGGIQFMREKLPCNYLFLKKNIFSCNNYNFLYIFALIIKTVYMVIYNNAKRYKL